MTRARPGSGAASGGDLAFEDVLRYFLSACLRSACPIRLALIVEFVVGRPTGGVERHSPCVRPATPNDDNMWTTCAFVISGRSHQRDDVADLAPQVQHDGRWQADPHRRRPRWLVSFAWRFPGLVWGCGRMICDDGPGGPPGRSVR